MGSFGTRTDGTLLLVAAIVAMAIGIVWLRRIATLDDFSDRSFWRSQREGGWGSWLPTTPEIPTGRWVVTRAEMSIAVVALAAAVGGPIVLTRWDRPLALAPELAVVFWLVAVASAAAGTGWILRIARRGPEAGPSAWRRDRLPARRRGA